MTDREGLTDEQRVRILRHLVSRAIRQVEADNTRGALDSLWLAFHATADPVPPPEPREQQAHPVMCPAKPHLRSR